MKRCEQSLNFSVSSEHPEEEGGWAGQVAGTEGGERKAGEGSSDRELRTPEPAFPAGCRTAPPHHFAELSLDDSGRQAVHPYVTLGQFYGQVLAEAQQGCLTDVVRAQALGRGNMG